MPRSDRRRRWAFRAVAALLWGAAVYYGLFGGEYSVFDAGRLEEEAAELRARRDSLVAVAGSLESYADSLETDSLLIERIARERYGLVRDGELLFRFLPQDTAGRRAER